MAKTPSPEPISSSVIEDKIVDFAEDLGKIFGTAEAKANTWLDQRKNILAHLVQVRDKAAELIHTLTGDGARAAAAVSVVRRGRPAGSKNVVKRGLPRKAAAATDAAGAEPEAGAAPIKRKRKGGISEAGRAAIAAAQKARWAAIKAGKPGKKK